MSLIELITNLKTEINSISFQKPQHKTQLLNKIANIEQKIVKQKLKQSNILAKLQAQIAKKAGKGKIDAAAANDISALLDQLIASSSLIPLDMALLQQLKNQITTANITAQLKANLLAKVVRLENMVGINRSLDTISKAVTKKGAKGVLTDVEVQNLLNLLDQIQTTL